MKKVFKTQHQRAVERIGKDLRDDKGLFWAWQSNIAMAFKDEYARTQKELNKRTLSRENIHDVANTAATNFIFSLFPRRYK